MRYMLTAFLFCWQLAFADTMNHFMNIVNSIPKMEMKADPQAQNWARSARNVLIVTGESIAETIMQANEETKSLDKPLFCLPQGVQLTATTLNQLIENTYKASNHPQKDKMTVSQVAWIAVKKKYPCEQKSPHAQQMEHISALMNH